MMTTAEGRGLHASKTILGGARHSEFLSQIINAAAHPDQILPMNITFHALHISYTIWSGRSRHRAIDPGAF